MIGYARLSRSELARRRRIKFRHRLLGSSALAALFVCACVAAALSFPARPPSPAAEQAAAPGQAAPPAPAPTPAATLEQPILSERIETIPDESVPTAVNKYFDGIPYFVNTATLTPVHAEGDELSEIVGSLSPGAVVFGFPHDSSWVCVVDLYDMEYFVRAEYLIPFSRDMSEVSIFPSGHEVISEGFTVNVNINSISGMTPGDMAYLLQDYPALQEIREHVLLFEKKYGVNAYFILGVASQESGYGTSLMAARKNNLFGIGAFDDDSYENALSFATKSEGVEYFCMLIAGYKENQRSTPAAINERYASDPAWANKVVYLMNHFSSKVHDRG
ncbi:MAG: glucosaminidase domain-containing protein [Clostridiales bacterium]|nr:glucosaminidase domain-containing protein [Clostridiales bacterium]